MKFLIVGLGNIGSEYAHTRHNIGFDTLDAFAEASNVVFEDKRYGAVATAKVKGHQLILLKPSTYMNLSGNAVRYWMQQENIPLEQVLVIVDDLALPFGLKNIQELIGTQNYARLRFGIGNDFHPGGQVDYVLGRFSAEQEAEKAKRIAVACDIIKSFCLAGLNITMNQYNNK